MKVAVANAQREAPVSVARITRLLQQATQQLRIDARGVMTVTFIPDARMKTLNRRFTGHNRFTDVLSFRYDGEPVVGEILIAPRAARAYAKRHGVAYAQELARYVVHGLLHWLGHEDRTPTEQRVMRSREDRLLSRCGIA